MLAVDAGTKLHPDRIRIMFAVNIVVALGFGIGLLFMPIQMYSMVGNSSQEVIWSTYGASYMVAIGLLAIAGLRSPVKFSFVLLVQAIAKTAWILAVIVPALVAGTLPYYGAILGATFVLFIVGDVAVIPWRHIMAK
jgi:hypothetical protein